MSIDRACSSSLNAITIGTMEIQTENSDIVLAGGMEHMTHVPLYNDPYIKYNSELMENPKYSKYDMDVSYHVGLTAEKLAQINNISREEMDKFSYDSQRLTARSIEEGYFRDEILPVTVTHEGNTKTVNADQTPRPNTTLEQMRQLKPAFKENGRVTAGNSPPLTSGSSLLMLMSGEKMKEYGLKPLARVIDYAAAGVDPTIMGHGPVPATEKLDNFREAAERNFNEIYDKLGNQKLSEENEENLSLALTMMEALGIDILHLIRDYEDLVDYLDTLRKL